MAMTGLALIGFVLVHMAGNLLIFAGKDAVNSYARHLEDLGGLLWVARALLLAIFVLHLLLAFRLTRENWIARPIGYYRDATVKANWASRHMMLTGLVILAFVIYHLLHFTFGVVDNEDFKYHPPAYRLHEGANPYTPDVARMVTRSFSPDKWPIAVSYILAQLFLGLHLWHGGSSWFQSLGLNRKRSAWLVGLVGPILAILVVVGNCSIPLAILLGYRPA
jgi:succinate dehydrogenase / fumarate reductase cytochrome b subunit